MTFKKGNKEGPKASREGRGAKPKYLEKALKDLLTSIDCGSYTMADKVIENLRDMLHERITVERLMIGDGGKIETTIDEHASDNARITTLRLTDALFGKEPTHLNHQFGDDGDGLHSPEERQSAKEAVDKLLKPKKGQRE